MPLNNFTIKSSSLMKLIIEREATFGNNSDIHLSVTQKNHHEHL